MRGIIVAIAVAGGAASGVGVARAEPSWVDDRPMRRPPGLVRIGGGGDLVLMEVGDQSMIAQGLHAELGVRLRPELYGIVRAEWASTGDGPEVMPPTGSLRRETIAARGYGCRDVSVVPCWAELGVEVETIRWDGGEMVRRPAAVLGLGFDYGIGVSVQAIAARSDIGAVDAGLMISARLGYGP